MDLSQRLAKAAVSRVSVLIVEVPGWAETRWAAERDVRLQGWRTATSPADADLLLTCGSPGAALSRAIDLTWAQLPGPRARAAALSPAEASVVLQRAADQLADERWQKQDTAERADGIALGSRADEPSSEDGADDAASPDADKAAGHIVQSHEGHGGMSHEDMGQGDSSHEGRSGMSHDDMGHDDSSHEGHDDMGHDDMDMSSGGIPLASGGGTDRDGLDLDVLHVPLGPVLPRWPAGLMLHCTLHGDVVTEARPEVLPVAPGFSPRSPLGTASDRLDRAAQLLALAGWDDAAAAAAHVRDGVSGAGGSASLVPVLDRLIRRVQRSRTLQWSLRGLGVIDAGFRRRHGLEEYMGGDVRERLIGFLTDARSAVNGGSAEHSPTPVTVLPELVMGLELSAVRLVVASVDVDVSRLRQVTRS